VYLGGWNGGGDSGQNNYTTTSSYRAGGGGGGTDIRTTQNTTYANRLIVAGGGGGGVYSTTYPGGNGGGVSGEDGGNTYNGDGGTQNAGGTANASGTSSVGGTDGALGTGGTGGSVASNSGGGGGGGGYYGGGGGATGNSTSSQGGGGGGSSYIGGVATGVTFMYGETGFVPNPDTTGNGTVIITSMAPCTGTPTAGTVSITSRNCASEPFTLSAAGATKQGGITYQWQRSDAGTGTWTDIPTATSASYTVTNQTVPSDYRFVVTCTNNNSTDISNIVTEATTVITANFSEDFDSTPAGTSGSTGNASPPACWTYLKDGLSSYYGYTYNSTVYANSPTNSFRFYWYNSSSYANEYLYLISPQTDDLGNGTKQVRFSARMSSATIPGRLEVVSLNDISSPAAATASATVLVSMDLNNDVYQKYILPLPATIDDYFAFRVTYDGSGITRYPTTYIDDVYYEDLSPCIFPLGIDVTNVTTTTANISWDASAATGVTGYEYEVRDASGAVVKSGSTT